jgi:hypothetical protein
MVEQQSAITAIRDSAAEGFVTGTLFSQGWDIHFRALDFDSLVKHLRSQDCRKSILFISTDCDGITQSGLTEISSLVQKVMLLYTAAENESTFSEALALPATRWI